MYKSITALKAFQGEKTARNIILFILRNPYIPLKGRNRIRNRRRKDKY